MSVSNGIITAPVSISDIQNAIGVAGGGDLATLCVSNNINPWAKYKPVRRQVIDTVDGQWDRSNNCWLSSAHWWKQTQAGSATQGGTPVGSCGFHIEYFTGFGSYNTSGTFAYKLINGLLGWTYEKPAGGSQSPYRQQDFAQYYHNAIQPYGELGTNEYHLNNQDKVTFQWDLPISQYPALNLALSDFAIGNQSLQSFHLGVILWDNSTSKVFISSGTFGSGDINIETDSDQSLAIKGTARQRTWNLMPFFSLNTDYNQTGIFISMANVSPSQITIMMHGSIYCMVMAEFNQAGTTISYTIDIVNETTSPRTNASVYVEIKKIPASSSTPPEEWSGDVYHNTITQTIAASTTTQIQGTASVSYDQDYIYWIMARVESVAESTSGYEQVDADIFRP